MEGDRTYHDLQKFLILGFKHYSKIPLSYKRMSIRMFNK